MGDDKTWRAGAASVTFTPDEPMWLAGYAVRVEPSRGTLSELQASALALEDAGGRVLVCVSADIIAIPRVLADAAVERVLASTDMRIPREHFLFAATHTHYAPEIRPDIAPFYKIPPQYAAKIPQAGGLLVEAMASAAVKALKNRMPVRVFAGRTSATFARNRRKERAVAAADQGAEQVWSRLIPAGASEFPEDHEVPVLDVRSPDGSHLAIVFGYACHNLTIDPQDLRYCADWAGFAREQLQQKNPGVMPLFITGCAADQDPHPRASIELSRQYGRELADAVEQCIQSDMVEVGPQLAIAMDDVDLEMQPVTSQWIETSLASQDPPRIFKAEYLQRQIAGGQKLPTTYPAVLQAIRLGRQVIMIALGGEPVIDWVHQFRNRFSQGGHPLVWVAGYCNHLCGYIPTRRIQREGGYEGGRASLWSPLPSSWTESVEERVGNAVDRLVRTTATD
jgi:hypothetical protein